MSDNDMAPGDSQMLLGASVGTGVLDGVVVLDYGRFVAGPCCAAILADLGALVIRVERIGGGEDRWMTPVTEQGEGAMFIQNNRNKLSLTLNAATAAGAEVQRRLIGRADVVVANLPDDALLKMGLDYDSLRAIKPDIITTTVTAFGRGGPYSDRVGFDGVGQVMSGAVYRSGPPDQPVRCVAPYADYSTALASCIGTLAALMHRSKTGRGQQVQASLLGTSLMISCGLLIEQAALKVNRTSSLNRGQTAGPADIFRTRDGWLLVQVASNPMFARWAQLVGEPDWVNDARFKNDSLRGTHADVLCERMARWCAERDRATALTELERARISAFSVNSPQEALDDPHVQAMGFLRPTDYPGLPAGVPIVDTPFRMSDSPPEIRHRAPTVGEHSAPVLQWLGYGDDEIEALRAQHVI